jgi:fluoroquinolone transport system permease protein
VRQTIKLFQIGLKQVAKDGLLVMLLPAPLMVGLLFKFGIPSADDTLIEKFSFSLLPWYGLADGMLLCLTPMFVAMVSAFLMLEERDEGISAFYQVTPTAGYSYLAARIGIPVLWAFAATVIVSGFLNISGFGAAVLWAGSLLSALTGIALSMMVVSIAGNRVEGLALSKMMSVSFLGLILYWFVSEPYSYILAFLPSFWIGKIIMDGATIISFILGLLSCFIWIFIFVRRFLRRMQ